MDVTSRGAVSARLALGVTTVAMVALASAGTAVVVRTGTSGVNLGSLPPQVSLPLGSSGAGAVIVGGPPGRAWPSDGHAVRRFAGRQPITVVAVQQPVSGPGGAVGAPTSFTDGAPPLPEPLVPIGPAQPQPVTNPPIQPPVANPPVANPPVQRPPTDPPAPVTAPTGPPVTGVQPAPGPVPPAPPAPAAGGSPAVSPVAVGTPGRPSTRGDQPSPTAEQPAGQPTVQPSPQVTAARPPKRTKAGHDQGLGEDGPERHARDGDGDQRGGGDQHAHDGGDQHGHDGGDQRDGGDDRRGHGHGTAFLAAGRPTETQVTPIAGDLTR